MNSIKTDISDLWNHFTEIISNAPLVADIAIVSKLRDVLAIYFKVIMEIATKPHLINAFLNNDIDSNIVGTSGINLPKLANTLSIRQIQKPEQIIKAIENIIWDLIVFESDIICPQCKGDKLQCLSEVNSTEIFLSCSSCFWTKKENGNIVHKSDSMIPADINKLRLKGYII